MDPGTGVKKPKGDSYTYNIWYSRWFGGDADRGYVHGYFYEKDHLFLSASIDAILQLIQD